MADKVSKFVFPVKSGNTVTNKEFELPNGSDNLGTAAYKDVPSSGNASSSQVVMGNDSRLSDSRNAKDVSAWAKASSKPSYTASEVGAIATSAKGAANGVAELDSSGKVPSSQLPSYVDDVLEYDSQSAFPSTGETGKIYVAKDTNKSYRWTGSAYSQIKGDLALGETSSTAYRGDRGKVAYDHSQSTHARTDATKTEASSTNGNIKINGTETTVYTHPGSGTNPHGTTKSDVGLGNVGNFKAVSTVASQGLTDTEKSNARANIGAGTSSSDTKNTAGSTDSSSKLFLIGATSQAANPQTYSHDTAYVGTDGCLYSGSKKVLTGHQDISGKANLASPTFTGTPKAPTAETGTNTTQIATTAFVKNACDALTSNFQAGVDDVYDAVVAKGSTPASKSLSDVVAGIENIPSGSGNAVAADVLSGKTFTNSSGSQTGSMTNRGAVSQTLNTSTTSYTIPEGYHNGSGKVSISTQEKTVTSSTSAQTVTPDSGKVLTKVTVNAISTQEKTVSASTSAQTVTPDSGKVLSKVTVNAISGTVNITSNGSANVAGYATANVSVPTREPTFGSFNLRKNSLTKVLNFSKNGYLYVYMYPESGTSGYQYSVRISGGVDFSDTYDTKFNYTNGLVSMESHYDNRFKVIPNTDITIELQRYNNPAWFRGYTIFVPD